MLQNLNWPTLQYCHKGCAFLYYTNVLTILQLWEFQATLQVFMIHHQQTYNFANIKTDAYIHEQFFSVNHQGTDALPPHVIESTSIDLFHDQIDNYYN